jgi:lysine 2,3-aminomutase
MQEWVKQLQQRINSLEKLKKVVQLSPQEEQAILATTSRWGTTPYFASLMDKEDPNCPIRRQVIPSLAEMSQLTTADNYLLWKENRATDEKRPDSIARHYEDRIAFTVNDSCAIYCRYCVRKEMTINKDMDLRLDVDEGLEWIKQHNEIRDVLVTGGDPFYLPDEKIAYLIEQLRSINHVKMIRFGTRVPVVLPQRITPQLCMILTGYHKVPIWINTQCNHPKEITEAMAKAVYDLSCCGISIGNQATLLKGINDDIETFRELHQKLVQVRVRPYYVYWCEPVPGTEHFQTPIEKGAELIRDALQGHTTGLCRPHYVVGTNIGKIPITPNYYFAGKTSEQYSLRNYQGKITHIKQQGISSEDIF